MDNRQNWQPGKTPNNYFKIEQDSKFFKINDTIERPKNKISSQNSINDFEDLKNQFKNCPLSDLPIKFLIYNDKNNSIRTNISLEFRHIISWEALKAIGLSFLNSIVYIREEKIHENYPVKFGIFRAVYKTFYDYILKYSNTENRLSLIIGSRNIRINEILENISENMNIDLLSRNISSLIEEICWSTNNLFFFFSGFNQSIGSKIDSGKDLLLMLENIDKHSNSQELKNRIHSYVKNFEEKKSNIISLTKDFNKSINSICNYGKNLENILKIDESILKEWDFDFQSQNPNYKNPQFAANQADIFSFLCLKNPNNQLLDLLDHPVDQQISRKRTRF